MKKIIAAVAITTTLVLTSCGTSQPKQADRIEEDEAGWDCHTMGNKVCGEDLPKGKVLLPESECPLIQPVCYDHMTPWAKGH
jgi:hypothetical protein